jgi:Flp pilus assembly protein TadD
MDFYASSLIIVTGDHGEGLGEHGEAEHGYFIYHSTTKVPLIVKPPGRQDARTITETVGLVDLVPTVLEYVGLPVAPAIHGINLSPLISEELSEREERYIYSESMTATKYGCSSLLGLETDHWKYVQTSRPELYEVTADPAEKENLVEQHPHQARSLQERLRAVLQENLHAGGDEGRMSLDADSLERLRQLGYTGGPVVESFEFDTDKRDPKDLIQLYPHFMRLDLLVDTRQYAKARKLCARILGQVPDIAYVHGKLGRMAIEQGRLDEAITHFREALRLKPEAALWHNNLGVLLVRTGRLDEAVSHFNEALRLALDASAATSDLDRTLTQQGLADSPVFRAYVNLGATFLKQGKYVEALDACRAAVRTDPTDAGSHHLLGVALQKLKRTSEAVEAYEEAVRLDPEHTAARRALEAASARETQVPTP